jgi:hypothetical protein
MTTIVTLYPNSVARGGYDPAKDRVLPAPAVIGDGSLADDSDATGVELGISYDAATGTDYDEAISADFTADPALNPTWMYVSLRAATPAGFPNASDVISHRYFYRTDGVGGNLYQTAWPDPLDNGTAAAADWFNEAFAGQPITPGPPSRDTNWLNLPSDFPELLDPLTTTGLRVSLYAETVSLDTRTPVLDLYEIRLVVAYEPTTSPLPYDAPCRLFPRDDDHGVGAGHVWPPPRISLPGGYV